MTLALAGDSHSGNPLSLVATWRLAGNLSALRIPAHAPPRAVEGLWRHTCFELFVRRGEGPAYRECNFSPSSEWAVYSFERYRSGMRSVDLPGDAPATAVSTDSAALILRACLPPDLITAHDATDGRRLDDELRLNVAAVIEDRHGTLSYWALTHPDPLRPDFHHPDGFVHEIRHRSADE